MYNQLIKQSNSIYVSIIFLILFGQNHLYVKDAILQGIPLFRRVSEDSACKLENIQFPVSRPDDRDIPFGCPSVHCSIRLDDVPYRPGVQQTKHHPSRPSLFREATVPAYIRPDVSAARPDASQ